MFVLSVSVILFYPIVYTLCFFVDMVSTCGRKENYVHLQKQTKTTRTYI